MDFVHALRHFLTAGGFTPPGEAQPWQRMLEAFALCFNRDNPGSFSCSGTAFLLSYSIVMLNSDLHKKGVRKKMTCAEFVNRTKMACDEEDLPNAFLEGIYEDIKAKGIKAGDLPEAAMAAWMAAWVAAPVTAAGDRVVARGGHKIGGGAALCGEALLRLLLLLSEFVALVHGRGAVGVRHGIATKSRH